MKVSFKSIIITLLFLALSSHTMYGGFKVVAHRGASSVAPENTLSSFSKAIETGAKFVELDVHLSADDSIIVIHDFTVDRTTNGKGNVRDLHYADLKQLDAGSWYNVNFKNERLPTLYEELILARGKATTICEVKYNYPNISKYIVDLVKSLNMEDQIIISSFDTTILENIKFLDPNLRVMNIVYGLDSAAINKSVTMNGVGVIANSNYTPELLNYAKENGQEILVWTIDDAAQIRNLKSIGVNGVLTDYPQKVPDLLLHVDSYQLQGKALNSSSGQFELSISTTDSLTGYDLERRVYTSLNWETAAHLPAGQNRTVEFYDSNLSSTLYYYRVKIIKANNQFDYTNIVVIDLRNEDDSNFEVFPNPFIDHLNVELFPATASPAPVIIFNILGEKVTEIPGDQIMKSNRIIINTKQLPAGIYFCEVISDNKVFIKKLLKIK